jgi:hypothetical protein
MRLKIPKIFSSGDFRRRNPYFPQKRNYFSEMSDFAGGGGIKKKKGVGLSFHAHPLFCNHKKLNWLNLKP